MPLRYKADPLLGRWVKKQREDRKQLHQLHLSHRRQLESIGFEFESPEGRVEREWNENFPRVKAYQRNGNYFQTPDDFIAVERNLAIWIRKQRQLYREGSLDQQKQEKLSSIGFVFQEPKEYQEPQLDAPSGEEERSWMQYYSSLVEFQKANGHLRVPISFDPDLAVWVVNQRRKPTHLTGNQMDLLRAIGFDFDGTRPVAALPAKKPKSRTMPSRANSVQHSNVPTEQPKPETTLNQPSVSIDGASTLLAAAIAWDPHDPQRKQKTAVNRQGDQLPAKPKGTPGTSIC